MQLTKWIKSENAAGRKTNYSTVARAIGVRPGTVESHAKGYKRLSVKSILAYEKLTRGKVTFEDWRKLGVRPRPSRCAPLKKAA